MRNQNVDTEIQNTPKTESTYTVKLILTDRTSFQGLVSLRRLVTDLTIPFVLFWPTELRCRREYPGRSHHRFRPPPVHEEKKDGEEGEKEIKEDGHCERKGRNVLGHIMSSSLEIEIDFFFRTLSWVSGVLPRSPDSGESSALTLLFLFQHAPTTDRCCVP